MQSVKLILKLLVLPFVLSWRRVLAMYIHLVVKANSCAKCPACGIRQQHDIRWSTEHGALIHVCKRCFAAWGEQPMVTAKSWAMSVVMQDEEGNVLQADGSVRTTTQHAQRTPTLVQEIKTTGRTMPVVVRMQSGGNA